jgi:outer membrane protein insertion porin family
VLLKYSLELRISLSDNPTMYVLMFMESGNVWKDFQDIKVFDLNRSVGFGGRIFMPMLGVLGYDVGYGIDADKNNPNISPWQYHFIFGIPF